MKILNDTRSIIAAIAAQAPRTTLRVAHNEILADLGIDVDTRTCLTRTTMYSIAGVMLDAVKDIVSDEADIVRSAAMAGYAVTEEKQGRGRLFYFTSLYDADAACSGFATPGKTHFVVRSVKTALRTAFEIDAHSGFTHDEVMTEPDGRDAIEEDLEQLADRYFSFPNTCAFTDSLARSYADKARQLST